MENTKKFADTAQYIVISMGDEQFGIDIKYIDNIVKMQHITRVPNVPSYVKGVINLRGEIVPIINLRAKMGLEEIEETIISEPILSNSEDSPAFMEVLANFSDTPILGILAGLVLTVIVQSSSATVAMLQSLSATGAMDFSGVYPIIMGINIGTCFVLYVVNIPILNNFSLAD